MGRSSVRSSALSSQTAQRPSVAVRILMPAVRAHFRRLGRGRNAEVRSLLLRTSAQADAVGWFRHVGIRCPFAASLAMGSSHDPADARGYHNHIGALRLGGPPCRVEHLGRPPEDRVRGQRDRAPDLPKGGRCIGGRRPGQVHLSPLRSHHSQWMVLSLDAINSYGASACGIYRPIVLQGLMLGQLQELK